MPWASLSLYNAQAKAVIGVCLPLVVAAQGGIPHASPHARAAAKAPHDRMGSPNSSRFGRPPFHAVGTRFQPSAGSLLLAWAPAVTRRRRSPIPTLNSPLPP